MGLKVSTRNIEENILVLVLFLPSLYYSLANLVGGFTILYFVCFGCGILSYVCLAKNGKAFLVMSALITFSLIYSLIINPQFGMYTIDGFSIALLSKSKLFLLLLLYLPLLLVGLSKKLNYRLILDRLFAGSIVLLPLDILIDYQRMTSGMLTDYMTIAYQILFWVMIAIVWEIHNKKKFTWIIIVPSLLMLIIGGSRGALLAIIVFCILLYIFRVFLTTKADNGIKVFVPFIIAIAAIIIVLNFEGIVGALENLTGRMGYNSRVLSQITNLNFFNNDDRTGLQSQVIPHLLDHLFGHGLFGDRFLITSGQYVHNFFIEIVVNFGVVIGAIILGYIILLTIKAMRIQRYSTDDNMQGLFVIAVTLIYVKFMISASYLESVECFFAIGILYNIVHFQGEIEYEYK